MEALAVAEVVDQRNEALEDAALAASCAAASILITAECAATVEHLARGIHAAGTRAASPFVRVAAAELPTDAATLTKTCGDLLAAVCGGSLLLTDVEQMPPFVQNRLLETFACLQADAAQRARLFAGTTTTLYERISDGTFSERLFYRLNTIHVVAVGEAADSASADIVA